jgi:hypothetical protein
LKTITIRFDSNARSVDTHPPIDDCEELIYEAERAGFKGLDVDWFGLFRGPLPVQDDLMFLAMNYNELDTFAQGGGTQVVYLGDGMLHVTVVLVSDLVAMKAQLAPHLDRRFLEVKELTIPLQAYLRAWSAAISSAMAQLRS